MALYNDPLITRPKELLKELSFSKYNDGRATPGVPDKQLELCSWDEKVHGTITREGKCVG